MMPLMIVPCPFSSQVPLPAGSTRSKPPTTLDDRAGLTAEVPESITATVTPAPLVSGQTLCGPSLRNGHGVSLTVVETIAALAGGRHGAALVMKPVACGGGTTDQIRAS